MAISATISVDKSWVTCGQKVRCLLTISNTGGADVKVTAVSRAQLSSSASNTESLPTPPNVTVPAGGNLVLPWLEVLACDIKPASQEFQFGIGATVYTDDGSVAVAPPATVIAVPARSGQSPVPGLYPNPPVVGQLRLESNLNSGLLAAFTPS